MSFPEDLDFDRVLYEALAGTKIAIDEWLDGAPISEEPLMNRLTAQFSRRRRSCDVGTTSPITMFSRVAFLHRQGENQTDAFGSDLAITVDIAARSFRKTALFQLKISDGFDVRLERSQLHEATENAATADRSFVLVADKTRKGVRVKAACDALEMFQEDADTATRNCVEWDTLGQWLSKWLSCDIGVRSDINDPSEIEPTLESFVVDAPKDWLSPWGTSASSASPSDARPAKAWLAMFFEPPKPPDEKVSVSR